MRVDESLFAVSLEPHQARLSFEQRHASPPSESGRGSGRHAGDAAADDADPTSRRQAPPSHERRHQVERSDLLGIDRDVLREGPQQEHVGVPLDRHEVEELRAPFVVGARPGGKGDVAHEPPACPPF